MKLNELAAHFTKYEERPVDQTSWEETNRNPNLVDRLFLRVETMAEADGVRFQCPKCKAAGSYAHPVFIGFRGKAAPGTYGNNRDGVPVLWDVAGGSSLNDLSLTPSIQIQGGCDWHGFLGSNGVPPGEAA